MKRILPFLTLLYPVLIFALRDSPYFMPAALTLGGLLVIDVVFRFPVARRYQIGGLGLIFSLATIFYILGFENVVRVYPFLMSGSMLMLFAATRDPAENPMIGPFRNRMSDPTMLAHLHRAKVIWVVGLSVNTLILGIFLFAFPLQTWILYASFHSYILLASLFALSIGYVALARRNLL